MQTQAGMKAGTGRVVEELFSKSFVGDKPSNQDLDAALGHVLPAFHGPVRHGRDQCEDGAAEGLQGAENPRVGVVNTRARRGRGWATSCGAIDKLSTRSTVCRSLRQVDVLNKLRYPLLDLIGS